MRPRSWRPLLSGHSREEALDTAVAIGRALNRSPFVRWHPKVPAAVRKEWWLLLNTGVPSRILLLAYLARSGVMPEARGQAAELFDRAVRALPRTHLEP